MQHQVEAILSGKQSVVLSDKQLFQQLVPHYLSRCSSTDALQLAELLRIQTFLANSAFTNTQLAIKIAQVFRARAPFPFFPQPVLQNPTLLAKKLENLLVLVKLDKWSVLRLIDLAPLSKPDLFDKCLYVQLLSQLLNQNYRNLFNEGKELKIESVSRVNEFLNSLWRQKTAQVSNLPPLDQVRKMKGSLTYQKQQTQSVKQALIGNNMFQVVSQHSSGKFTIASQALRQMSLNFLAIHLTRQTDFKSLVGSFVCSQRLGEFKWVDGPLTHCAKEGLSIVFKNFQQANQELVMSLVHLAEHRLLQYKNSQIPLTCLTRFVAIGHNSHYRGASDQIAGLSPYCLFEKAPQHFKSLFIKIVDFYKLNLAQTVKMLNRARVIWLYLTGSAEFDGYPVEKYQEGLLDCIKEIASQKRFRTNRVSITVDQQSIKIDDFGPIRFSSINSRWESAAEGRVIFAQSSLFNLKRIVQCVACDQSCLLVGQTGEGKTTLVEYISKVFGKKLYIYNMNQGSDSLDLFGGFKPADSKFLSKSLFNDFVQKFKRVKYAAANHKFIHSLQKILLQGNLKLFFKSIKESAVRIYEAVKREQGLTYAAQFQEIIQRATRLDAERAQLESSLSFVFLQGNLVKAYREGHWLLVDQINLSSNDVLQRLVPVIQKQQLVLMEKGEVQTVKRHPEFRFFSCMNPGSQVGKKPLPKNVKAKLTVVEIEDMTQPSDLQFFLQGKLSQRVKLPVGLNKIAELYLQLKLKHNLNISLRNLSRAVGYINQNLEIYGEASISDGLMLGFSSSCTQPEKLIINERLSLIMKQVPRTPLKERPGYALIHGTYVKQGNYHCGEQKFLVTEGFKGYLDILLKAVGGTDLPVLLEGPTSAGKTSMVRYVASLSGHRCVRINNHEHTDVEQYLGCYYPTKAGRFQFVEGALVQAVRKGYWLILDQLNLARSQILECLNRLLDDNRQLLVVQTQTYLKPHPDFRIFATQNPSSYGGRKQLSRAFTNRFIHLLMEDIPSADVQQIVQARSKFLEDSPPVRKAMLGVFTTLQKHRRKQNFFMGRQSAITLRDLLKWATRGCTTKLDLAYQGFSLLGERARHQSDRNIIKSTIEQQFKVGVLQPASYYEQYLRNNLAALLADSKHGLFMFPAFARMASIAIRAAQNNQPILLVGETGCGKTTLAQLMALLRKKPLFSINCHKHTEASDFIGALRPARRQPNLAMSKKFRQLGIQQLFDKKISIAQRCKILGQAKSQELAEQFKKFIEEEETLFEWQDGPLVQSMKQGAVLLIDEISLADDSVLERLNSVFQMQRRLLITEGEQVRQIEAKEGWVVIATMNPGDDHGKRQISPALRNRMTQIWVEPVTAKHKLEEGTDQLQHLLSQMLRGLPHAQICKQVLARTILYLNTFLVPQLQLQKKNITLRDIKLLIQIYKQLSDSHEPNLAFRVALQLVVCCQVDFYPVTRDSHESIKQQIRAHVGFEKVDGLLQYLKLLSHPLMVRTSLPVEYVQLVLGKGAVLHFNDQSELADFVGRDLPKQNSSQFEFSEGPLLNSLRSGGATYFVDVDLAQQQVVEGLNSVFDHRGSIYVVQLDQTINKAAGFRPIVVLRQNAPNRKILPGSFINRFIKFSIPEPTLGQQVAFFRSQLNIDETLLHQMATRLSIAQNKFKIAIKLNARLKFIGLLMTAGFSQAYRLTFNNLAPAVCNDFEKLFGQFARIERRLFVQAQILKQLPLRRVEHGQQYSVDQGWYSLLRDLLILLQCNKGSIALVADLKYAKQVALRLQGLISKQIIQIQLPKSCDLCQLQGGFDITNDDVRSADSESLQFFSGMDKVQWQETVSNKLQEYKRQALPPKGSQPRFVFIRSAFSRHTADDNKLCVVQSMSQRVLQMAVCSHQHLRLKRNSAVFVLHRQEAGLQDFVNVVRITDYILEKSQGPGCIDFSYNGIDRKSISQDYFWKESFQRQAASKVAVKALSQFYNFERPSQNIGAKNLAQLVHGQIVQQLSSKVKSQNRPKLVQYIDRMGETKPLETCGWAISCTEQEEFQARVAVNLILSRNNSIYYQYIPGARLAHLLDFKLLFHVNALSNSAQFRRLGELVRGLLSGQFRLPKFYQAVAQLSQLKPTVQTLLIQDEDQQIEFSAIPVITAGWIDRAIAETNCGQSRQAAASILHQLDQRAISQGRASLLPSISSVQQQIYLKLQELVELKSNISQANTQLNHLTVVDYLILARGIQVLPYEQPLTKQDKVSYILKLCNSCFNIDLEPLRGASYWAIAQSVFQKLTIPLHQQQNIAQQLIMGQVRLAYIKSNKLIYDQAARKAAQIEKRRIGFVPVGNQAISLLNLRFKQAQAGFNQAKKSVRFRGTEFPFQTINQFFGQYFTLIKEVSRLTQQFARTRKMKQSKRLAQSASLALRCLYAYFPAFYDILLPTFTALILLKAAVQAQPNRSGLVQNLKDRISSRQSVQGMRQQIESIYSASILSSKQINQVSRFISESESSIRRAVEQQKQKQAGEKFIIFQKKVNEAVIDQYTEEGKQQRRLAEEQQMKELYQAEQTDQVTLRLESLAAFVLKYQERTLGSKGVNKQRAKMKVHLASWQRRQDQRDLRQLWRPKSSDDRKVDVFRSVLPQQSKLVGQICNGVISKYKQLGEQCPQFGEVKSKDKVAFHANHFRELRVFQLTLHEVLSFSEELLAKLEEYNLGVPTSLKIVEEVGQLQRFVMKWRRIQRDNWSSLLQQKEKQLQRLQVLTFLDLKKQLAQCQSPNKVFELLDSYLSNSQLGTFKFRLCGCRMLRQLIGSAQIEARLSQVDQFYSQLEKAVEQFVAEQKSKLEGEITEYRRFAGWKSKHFAILQATYDKFRKKIYKITKRYRALLEGPIKPVLVNSRSKFAFNSFKEALVQLKKEALEKTVPEDQFALLFEQILELIDQLKDQQSSLRKFTAVKQTAESILEQVPRPQSKEVFSRHWLLPALTADWARVGMYRHRLYDNLCRRGTQVGWKQTQLIELGWKVVQNFWSWSNLYLEHKAKSTVLLDLSGLKQLVDLLSQAARTMPAVFEGTGLDQLLHQLQLVLVYKKTYPKLTLQKQIEKTFKKCRLAGEQKYIAQEVKAVEAKAKALVGELPDIIAGCKVVQETGLPGQPFRGQWLATFCKAGWLISTIVLNLQAKGFCNQQQQQEGNSGQYQNKQGTGMGEGAGAANVAEQIEHQQQLLGNNREKGGKEQGEDPMGEQDKHFSVDEDFDGQDASLPSKSDGEQADSKSMDQKFGDVEDEQQEDLELDDRAQSEKEEEEDGKNRKQGLDFKTDQKKKDDKLKAKEERQKKEKALSKEQLAEGQEDGEGEEQNQLGQEEMEEGYWNDMKEGERLQEQEEGCEDLEGQGQNEGDEGEGEQGEGEQGQDQAGEQDELEEGEFMEQERQEEQRKSGQGEEQMEEQVQHDNETGQVPKEEMEQEQQKEPAFQSKNKKKQKESYGKGKGDNEVIECEDQQGEQGEQAGEGSNGGVKSEPTPNPQLRTVLERVFLEAQPDAIEQGLKQIEEQVNCRQDQQQEQCQQGKQYRLDSQGGYAAWLSSLQPKKEEQKRTIKPQEKEAQKRQKQPSKTGAREQFESRKSQLQAKGADKSQIQQQPFQVTETRFREKELANSDAPIQQQSIDRGQVDQLEYMREDKDRGQAGSVDLDLQGLEQQSKQMAEKLGCILECKAATAMAGDFRSGKRLNTRKIIPFIASNYRKDRIWLRRAEPSERDYRVLIGIDDSASMAKLGRMALHSCLVLLMALQRLKIPTAIARLAKGMTVVHEGHQTATPADFKRLASSFSFSYGDADSMNLSLARFMKEAIALQESFQGAEQICFIISDGRFNKAVVQDYVRAAQKRGFVFVYVILESDQEQESILKIRSVGRDAAGKLSVRDYLDDFPFRHFTLLRDVGQLGELLSDILSQFIDRK